jgi:hypothetical protein
MGFDDSKHDEEAVFNETYPQDELSPGGSGKQGDQQQMGKDREPRKDKSHNELGGDKEHVDERQALDELDA